MSTLPGSPPRQARPSNGSAGGPTGVGIGPRVSDDCPLIDHGPRRRNPVAWCDDGIDVMWSTLTRHQDPAYGPETWSPSWSRLARAGRRRYDVPCWPRCGPPPSNRPGDPLAMSRPPRPFAVGLIQMRCSDDPEDNLGRALRPPTGGVPAGSAGRLPARAVPHPGRASARSRTPRGLIWPSRSRAPRPRPSRGSLARRRWSWSAPSSSGGRRASTTTPRSSWMPTARSSAGIARCTSPTTLSISRSITSRPATWASRRSRLGMHAWGRWSAGTSGIPRRPG